jgi:hypothetical protein
MTDMKKKPRLWDRGLAVVANAQTETGCIVCNVDLLSKDCANRRAEPAWCCRSKALHDRRPKPSTFADIPRQADNGMAFVAKLDTKRDILPCKEWA